MSYASVIAADGPVSWYRLIEQGGGSSRSRGSDPASLYATAQLPLIGFTGVANDGGAVLLTASASLTGYPDLFTTGSGGHTIECWVYTMGYSPFSSNTQAIPLQVTIGSSTLPSIGTINNSSVPFCVDRSASSENVLGTTRLATGWHHIAAVRSSGSPAPLTLYADGAFIGSTSSYAAPLTAQPVRVQLLSVPSVNDLLVAEPAVYYSPLTATQIAAHAGAADTLAPPRWVQRQVGNCA